MRLHFYASSFYLLFSCCGLFWWGRFIWEMHEINLHNKFPRFKGKLHRIYLQVIIRNATYFLESMRRLEIRNRNSEVKTLPTLRLKCLLILTLVCYLPRYCDFKSQVWLQAVRLPMENCSLTSSSRSNSNQTAPCKKLGRGPNSFRVKQLGLLWATVEELRKRRPNLCIFYTKWAVQQKYVSLWNRTLCKFTVLKEFEVMVRRWCSS